MSLPEATPEELGEGLVAFVRRESGEILAEWEATIRELPSARGLDRSGLLDHMPDVLERVTCVADAILRGGPVEAPKTEAERHALDRLGVGFDLGEVVLEYSHLRACVLRRWEAQVGCGNGRMGVAAFNLAVDRAIAASVERYTEARDRTLRAIDRISTAALESHDLTELLRKLLQVLVETTEATDTAVILLRDGDVLRTRAAVGLEAEVAAGFTLRIGEGFAGTIAAEGRPLLLKSASDDALVKSDHLRAKGVRGLYGVPLVAGDEVLGVTHIGSLSAFDFSDQDKQLLRAVAHRAAMAVTQHVLRDREREATAALDAERRWWKGILEALPVGVVVAEAPSGLRTFANRRAQELIGAGYVRLGEVGDEERTVQDLGGAPVPGDRIPLSRALRGETVVGEELVLPLLHPPVTVRTHAAPLTDPEGTILGAAVAFDDVSEQKRVEAEQRFLKEATAVLASTLDDRETLARVARLAVPRMADWCSVDLRVEGGTERLVVEHAEPAKVVRALELRRRFPIRSGEGWGVARVLQTGRAELHEEVSEDRLRELAHAPEHLEGLVELGMRSAMIVPMVAHGTPIGAISFVTAESGRRYGPRDLEVAQELATRAALALENARLFREAQEAFQARQRVLAIVSHDLRNPIAAMKMGLAVLEKAVTEPLQREVVTRMGRSVQRMQHLVRDLLDLASVEAGRLSVELGSHRFDQLLAEAIEAEEPAAVERGLVIERGPVPDGVLVRCDRHRVLQVLGNLVGNAVKFARRGDRIRVGAEVAGGQLEVEVSDSGPGIAPEDLPHLFAPYWSGARQAGQGTGLGLYISKAIVEAHGGRIGAESGPDGGSRFRFTLPIAR